MVEAIRSKVSLAVHDGEEELIAESTSESFLLSVYDGEKKKTIGRITTTEAGLSFIYSAIGVLLEALVDNQCDLSEVRDVLHDMVDTTVDNYTVDAPKSELN